MGLQSNPAKELCKAVQVDFGKALFRHMEERQDHCICQVMGPLLMMA